MPRYAQNIEAGVFSAERELFAAIKDKDAVRLSHLLTNDFVYRSPGNADATKAEFLANIQALSLEILTVWADEMKVSVYGKMAVLTGVQKAQVRSADGGEIVGTTVFTDIFVRRRGRWLLALAYGVELPEAK